MSDKQYGPAVQAARTLCKLDGLFAPTEVSVTSEVTHKVKQMTSADRRKRLTEILEQHAPLSPSKANGKTNGKSNGRALN
jgi:hypothetical protein